MKATERLPMRSTGNRSPKLHQFVEYRYAEGSVGGHHDNGKLASELVQEIWEETLDCRSCIFLPDTSTYLAVQCVVVS